MSYSDPQYDPAHLREYRVKAKSVNAKYITYSAIAPLLSVPFLLSLRAPESLKVCLIMVLWWASVAFFWKPSREELRKIELELNGDGGPLNG